MTIWAFLKKSESSNDVLEIDMDSSNSVLQSNLNNRPLCYSGYLYHTNRCRRSDIIKAGNLMGKDFFSAWGIPDSAYSEEESKVIVTVRQCTKRDFYPQDVLEALELITKICCCICNKRHMKRVEFSQETLYDIICVLAVW